ncbi:MAG: ATP-grasp domain-containing protein [Firmicutes bacterium]|nr:ATP-grasp domain-containing protein [Bacillota bacterium]
MKYVVVTDGRYRSAIAAVRAFGKAGYRVIVTQTRTESPEEPPVFQSRFAEGRWIEGSCDDKKYADRMYWLLAEMERPVLFCTGAATLNAVAGQRERFSAVCDFLIASPKVLDQLNDKEAVHKRALSLGLPVPAQYEGLPDRYPVVVKPHCGEKLGLKAQARYAIAENEEEFQTIMKRMRQYDPDPLVQEKVTGAGSGASLLMDRDGRLISAICHRRIREYPYTGGPSTCCVSYYDEKQIEIARRLLASFKFTGLAMVEFKGNAILEVNPRVWGSFPLTEAAGSPFCEHYARAAQGETVEYTPQDYRTGTKMRFFFNDLAATLDCFRHGKVGEGFRGIADFFLCKEALHDPKDRKAYRKYLRSYLPF